MYPVLFEFFGHPVGAYPVAVVLAFSVGIGVARSRSPRLGLHPDLAFDLGMVIFVAAFLGARALWVATHLEGFREGETGLSVLGAVVASIGAGMLFLRWRGAPVLRYADLAAVSMPLGEAFVRLGCFGNGCCFGRATGLPWAVGGLHPTQLYTTFLSLAIFFVLLRVARRSPAPGTVFAVFLVLLGLSRFALEIVRQADPTTVLTITGGIEFTTNQALSGALAVAGFSALLALRAARSRLEPPLAMI